MSEKEIISRIKRNKNRKCEAIALIADFLMIRKEQAREIYKKHFGEGR